MTNKAHSSIEPCSLPVSNSMKLTLQRLLKSKIDTSDQAITLNFRDSSYSAESGGYHPVEIRPTKASTGNWCIQYITDFAYTGRAYPELERSVDFDIANGACFFADVGWQPIDTLRVGDFYKMWESNFLSYLNSNTYDDITTTQS